MQSSPMPAITPEQRVLDNLRDTLQAYVAGDVAATAVVTVFRGQAPALALPEAFQRVLDELLRRLEMADVFSQDSCSFSSTGIQEQLGVWLDKAEARVSARTA
ncbi:hypothetical protein [Imbroritus primus]